MNKTTTDSIIMKEIESLQDFIEFYPDFKFPYDLKLTTFIHGFHESLNDKFGKIKKNDLNDPKFINELKQKLVKDFLLNSKLCHCENCAKLNELFFNILFKGFLFGLREQHGKRLLNIFLEIHELVKERKSFYDQKILTMVN